MKHEFLNSAILSAAMMMAFLVGFPLGSIAHNFFVTASDSEMALPDN
jgi:predicted Co/Zn/Cd cation transporter (cation efflux family)